MFSRSRFAGSPVYATMTPTPSPEEHSPWQTEQEEAPEPRTHPLPSDSTHEPLVEAQPTLVPPLAEHIRMFAEKYFLNFLEDPNTLFFLKDSQLRYLDAGDGFCSHFGVTRDAVSGKTDFDLLARENAEQCQFDDLLVRSTGQTVVSELQIVLEGIARTVRFLKAAIRMPSSEGVCILGLAQDVTNESSLNTLETNSQSIETNDQFSREIAHELGNLLTPISGNLSFLLAKMDPSDSNYALLAQTEHACSHAIHLFRRLCSSSNRAALVRPAPLSLNSVVADFLSLYEDVVPPSLRIQTRLAADLGDVFADREQMLHVLSNLFFNARDAMPEGGTLVLETSNVGTADGAESEYIRLRVSDTGEGIPQVLHSRIFTPFFSSKGQGRGQGLALVARVVRQARGWISCCSLPKRGTDFYVTFPRHLPPS